MNGNLDLLLELLRQHQQQGGYLAQVMQQPQLPQAMPEQGFPNIGYPVNNYASQQQIDNSGRVINPLNGGMNAPLAIFDPRTQMGGHEMNVLGRYRYQDL